MPQARVLSDSVVNGHPVKCNHVIEADAKTVKSLEEGGHVDSNKEAVAYALSENPDVIDCTNPPADEAAAEAPAAEPAAETAAAAPTDPAPAAPATKG